VEPVLADLGAVVHRQDPAGEVEIVRELDRGLRLREVEGPGHDAGLREDVPAWTPRSGRLQVGGREDAGETVFTSGRMLFAVSPPPSDGASFPTTVDPASRKYVLCSADWNAARTWTRFW
jgi:hypothetical protein